MSVNRPLSAQLLIYNGEGKPAASSDERQNSYIFNGNEDYDSRNIISKVPSGSSYEDVFADNVTQTNGALPKGEYSNSAPLTSHGTSMRLNHIHNRRSICGLFQCEHKSHCFGNRRENGLSSVSDSRAADASNRRRSDSHLTIRNDNNNSFLNRFLLSDLIRNHSGAGTTQREDDQSHHHNMISSETPKSSGRDSTFMTGSSESEDDEDDDVTISFLNETPCTRHHHRRNSTALKFEKPHYV